MTRAQGRGEEASVDIEPEPAAAKGEWKDRPPGVPQGVPPPSIPLRFLGAAAVGLVACGAALIAARGHAVADPTDDRVVGAAHLAMLATLSMGILGALHQFTPVITRKPLRSLRLSRATFLSWLVGSWLLPIGFMTRRELVVEVGGAFAGLAVVVLVANMSSPLRESGKGAPVAGLRMATTGFVATACYGVVYVADRQAQWFDLSGHVVLAHAVVGLLAWLGLTYLSVSEKLWPMFMLAHVPGRRRAPWLAVYGVFLGVALLSPGLLVGAAWLAILGAAVVATGLGAHVLSLVLHVRHRRRAADLHLWFVVSSAAWLLAGAGLAVTGVFVMGRHHHAGVGLVAASVSAVAGWLLVALVGHSYKIVPFIAWSALRGRGIATTPGGAPLLFANLYNHRWSSIDFAAVNAGVLATTLGLAVTNGELIGVGGGLFVVAGLVSACNLSWRPARLLRAAPPAPAAAPAPLTMAAVLRSRGAGRVPNVASTRDSVAER
jgi:hypothetical protein